MAITEKTIPFDEAEQYHLELNEMYMVAPTVRIHQRTIRRHYIGRFYESGEHTAWTWDDLADYFTTH